jgi:predicted PurR-regulated permease PerM
MIGIMPTFRDKKRALTIAYDVEKDVSRYLFTISLINIAFGIYVGIAMTFVGMPNPILWAVAAFLLNYIPYIGALAGIVMVCLVGLMSFDSLVYSLIAPLLYLFGSIMEGQFITPVFLGRRLELNSVAIFIFIALWSWLWGIVGAIIAVPLLVSIKVFCDHFEGLAPLGEFLSGPKTENAGQIETNPGSV